MSLSSEFIGQRGPKALHPGGYHVNAEGKRVNEHGRTREEERAFRRSVEGRIESVGKKVSSWWGPIVVFDFLAGVSLMFVGYNVTGNLPGGLLTAVVFTFVAMFRPATLKVKNGGLMFLAMLALLIFLAVESEYNGMRWVQRDSKFLIILLAAGVIASGRIHFRSLIIGGMVGALLNVPMFYLHVTPNMYPPYLTGYYLDKNVAGMYYAIWGVLGLTVLPKKWHKYWIFLSFGLLFLTGSRTSMAALAVGLAWVLVRNRTGVVFRVILGILGYFFLDFVMNNFSQNKAFGNRTGDDWFRQQIELAMTAKTHVTPWYGLGLNQGFVVLGKGQGNQRNAFFHNSYQQAFVEGGWPFLLVVIIAFLVIGLGLLDRRPVIPKNLIRLEGSVIVLLVCAWKLGEVFMTLGAFVVLGMCLAYRLGQPTGVKRTVGNVMRRAEERNLERQEQNQALLEAGNKE